MVIFCKDSRFLADNGKKTALSHKNPRFLAALRTLCVPQTNWWHDGNWESRWNWVEIVLRELLAAYMESVEGMFLFAKFVLQICIATPSGITSKPCRP